MSNLDTSFVNLKILAKLQPFERLNTRSPLFYVEKENSFPFPVFLLRWWRNDGREHCVTRLKELYAYVLEYLDNANSEEQNRIGEHLYESSIGINNLKKTYCGDTTTISQLENILDSIQKHMIKPKKETIKPKKETKLIQPVKID